MGFLSPTRRPRLNEVTGLIFLAAGLLLWLSLLSYHWQDPSWNTAAGAARPRNLVGYVGSHVADLSFQAFGLAAFVFPLLLLLLAWKWIRSEAIESVVIKAAGSILLLLSICTGLALAPDWRFFPDAIPAGGLVGMVIADYFRGAMNITGAAVLAVTSLIVSIYLISSFTLSKFSAWFQGPLRVLRAAGEHWSAWREERQRRKRERAEARAEARPRRMRLARLLETEPEQPPVASVIRQASPAEPPMAPPIIENIPIRTLDDVPPPARQEHAAAFPPAEPEPEPMAAAAPPRKAKRREFQMPATELLNETPGRNPYDEEELKDTAGRIKSKFEEFNVLGSVVQINPGPVVTTFEFKPEAGIKYSRIITLNEDLCLGLQAESILIERIPGKPTVGIEVPNTRREVIGLRQMLESDEFQNAPSRLTIPLGKDINGRIKMASLDTMPHLLIAGSTGSGKSVMLNSMIMAILFKSTPDQVRMILVDPKRLELGLYEGIPHLLTPVITDTKKATNALRNAVLEMERRLRLLASQGVRNIEQFNRKVRQLQLEPRSLFAEEEAAVEELEPLPYIVVFIDELADLMMVERGNVEEAVTRLAQMARAVGIHLVLATQRPSVDVVTGLIKANFPARISFRVATRVDSRTILDVMGAEHLLGKGDMLFLPPGSSRLIRVHGALVTEREINKVVDFWKLQATPEYDATFLEAPPSEEDEEGIEEFDGEQDPLYEDAVRVVCELGKASTSTLQRRLRLGYGRAARILDMMQREGIIGPVDGSKPREVLKRPEWLEAVRV
jgi:S-DNA-T family DNA segregation ATPase FtsK/SpoIIIE